MTDNERIEHISEAYADVSTQLGIERLRLQDNESKEQLWCVERLEKAHEHLRIALVGTPRERMTREQWAAALSAAEAEDD